jgi:hypothetical protein
LLASSTASTPSLSRGSLRRQPSAIRTGCANERPSGSARGVPGRLVSLPRSNNLVVSVNAGSPAISKCLRQKFSLAPLVRTAAPGRQSTSSMSQWRSRSLSGCSCRHLQYSDCSLAFSLENSRCVLC